MSDNEPRHGVLHTPESYTGLQDREYHIFYNEQNDVFVMVQALLPVAEILHKDGSLDHVVTIRARDVSEAEKRKVEIENWHRGLTRYEH